MVKMAKRSAKIGLSGINNSKIFITTQVILISLRDNGGGGFRCFTAPSAGIDPS